MPREPQTQTEPRQHEIVHHLHALLHTLRVLGQQEDQFCTLMHAVERAGKLNVAESRELSRLLEQTPAESLLHDVEAVRGLLRPAAAAKTAEAAHAD